MQQYCSWHLCRWLVHLGCRVEVGCRAGAVESYDASGLRHFHCADGRMFLQCLRVLRCGRSQVEARHACLCCFINSS